MATGKKVTNGGSAIGEAIGDLLEEQVHAVFKEIESRTHSRFITKYGKTAAGKDSKKLLLPDDLGNEYNIDGLVIDEGEYPLILVESKYIRYKKHNRDKASWICNAHSAIRKHFPSIRSSVAVLAGNWSETSLEMLKSNRVTYFRIPFEDICTILESYGIDFKWEENDKTKAMQAWKDFCKLSVRKKKSIGLAMINVVKKDLVEYVEEVLNDTGSREVGNIIVELRTNKGETFTYDFETAEKAAEFFEKFDNNFDQTQFVSISQHSKTTE